MPLSKKRKSELVSEYAQWINQSSAVIMAEFPGVAAKDMYALRVKLRDMNSQLHVVKLTLFTRALTEAGLPVPENMLTGSMIMAFAQDEPPATAKALMDFARDFETFQVKGGLLGDRIINEASVKALADLPPRPIVLAGLISTLEGPLSQLINVLNAPLREITQVLMARSEQGQAEALA